MRGIGIIGGGALVAAAAATTSIGLAPLAVAGFGNHHIAEKTSTLDRSFLQAPLV